MRLFQPMHAMSAAIHGVPKQSDPGPRRRAFRRDALAATSAGARSGCRGAPARQTADFASRGPRPVGVRTFHFVDQTRATPPHGSFAGTPFRPLDIEVWYPAATPPAGTALRDAPLDSGGAPYPLVLYGHALQDSRLGEAYLAEHLASRGYVVAAVDFPLGKLGAPGGATPDDLANQPGDLRVVLEHLLAGDGGLAGAVDAERVGASGLSLGAATVMLLAYDRDLRDRRVRAVLPIAPAFSCAFTRAFYKGVRLPLLVLQGDADGLAPIEENGLRVVRRARGPRTLVELHGGSHLGFTGFASVLGTPESIDRFGCDSLLAATGSTRFSRRFRVDAARGLRATRAHRPARRRRRWRRSISTASTS